MNYGTKCTIRSYSGDEKDVVIPSYVDGIQITSIENSAFTNNTNLESIIISDGVISIGGDCFEGCVNLKKVVLPTHMDVINSEAFKGCYLLEDLVLPNYISNIYDHAFQNCQSLTSFKIPSGIKTITYGLFYGCKKLKNIELNDEINKIETSAFSQTSIEYIELPSTINELGDQIFTGCSNLKLVKINEPDSGSLSIGRMLFDSTMKETDIIIPKATKFWKLTKNEINSSLFNKRHIFYLGTEEDFKNIVFLDNYEYGIVENKNLYFYSESPDVQSWHYVDGEPTIYNLENN